MTTATATTLSAIGIEQIASICVRRSGSKRSNSYSNLFDLVSIIEKHGNTKLEWDHVYGCYVMTECGGKLATMMVFVSREVAESDQ